MLPIDQIAAKIGLSDNDLEPYGRYTAKISLSRLPAAASPPKAD